MELVTVKCLRCGKSWTPRKLPIIVCAKCHSPYWNIPKAEKDIQQPNDIIKVEGQC
jgi:Zn finger protein HypA/HybF involved in hydrogenase expression